jgi:hypothetical protein
VSGADPHALLRRLEHELLRLVWAEVPRDLLPDTPEAEARLGVRRAVDGLATLLGDFARRRTQGERCLFVVREIGRTAEGVALLISIKPGAEQPPRGDTPGAAEAAP